MREPIYYTHVNQKQLFLVKEKYLFYIIVVFEKKKNFSPLTLSSAYHSIGSQINYHLKKGNQLVALSQHNYPIRFVTQLKTIGAVSLQLEP